MSIIMTAIRSIFETVLFLVINFPVRSDFTDRNRWRLLRLAGMNAARSRILYPVNLTQVGELHRISIGINTFINSGLNINVADGSSVRIGELCTIGPNASFQTMGHNLVWSHGWGFIPKPITVGDKCWLGANVTVLGGVTIGEGAVVAAGAVVTKNVAPYTLVGGVPAKFIKRLKYD